METTVTLQAALGYSWWLYLISAVLLVAAIVVFLNALKTHQEAQQADGVKEIKVKTPAPRSVLNAKNKHLAQINALLNEYKAGSITKRTGYQRLSLIIRSFVHETTGINVENCTLREIESLGIQGLNELMKEYYVPEFGEDRRSQNADLSKSCKKTMGVISSWN